MSHDAMAAGKAEPVTWTCTECRGVFSTGEPWTLGGRHTCNSCIEAEQLRTRMVLLEQRLGWHGETPGQRTLQRCKAALTRIRALCAQSNGDRSASPIASIQLERVREVVRELERNHEGDVSPDEIFLSSLDDTAIDGIPVENRSTEGSP